MVEKRNFKLISRFGTATTSRKDLISQHVKLLSFRTMISMDITNRKHDRLKLCYFTVFYEQIVLFYQFF